MDIPNVRVHELADIYDCKNASVSMFFKRNPKGIIQKGNRIIGLQPEASEAFLLNKGFAALSKTFIAALGTNVGGAGKTSSTIHLGTSARRMTGRDKAVVLIDTDSQASLTLQVLGHRIPGDEFVLDDYLKESCELDDILTPIGNPEDNFWLIGSNLSNLYLDQRFATSLSVKNGMLNLVKEIIGRYGEGTKIFIDTAPQLSAVSQSTMCALAQSDVPNCFLIPIRPDTFSMEGASICISEMDKLRESLKGVDVINTKCFLSSYDQRTQVSIAIMRDVLKHETLSKFMCSTVIRHSTEVSRSAYKQETIFNATSNSARNLISDYSKLFFEVLGCLKDSKAGASRT